MPRGPRRYSGFVTSVLLHAAVVLLLLPRFAAEMAGSDVGDPWEPRGGGGREGGGSGREKSVAYIILPATSPPPSPAVVAAKVPSKVIEAPISPVTPEQRVDSATVATDVSNIAAGSGESAGPGAQAGPGTGGGTGGGVGPGRGIDSGPGTGGGGRGGLQPDPRQVIVPPFEERPKELKGQRVLVKFWVSADGRVDRVEVEPPIHDRDFSKKFTDAMRKYLFRPARLPDGRAVAGFTTIEVVL